MWKLALACATAIVTVCIAGCGGNGGAPSPGTAATQYAAEVDKVKDHMIERMKKKPARGKAPQKQLIRH